MRGRWIPKRVTSSAPAIEVGDHLIFKWYTRVRMAWCVLWLPVIPFARIVAAPSAAIVPLSSYQSAPLQFRSLRAGPHFLLSREKNPLADVMGLIAARPHLAKWHLIPDDQWQPEFEKTLRI
jgi:hypothetical protein